jgi:limonene-1,2-epoxide hydrolase
MRLHVRALYVADVTRPKVMGIFEVDGDCIVAWRDYFDVNSTRKLSKDQR